MINIWKKRKYLGEKSSAKKDYYSFLPGVLEVTDKPPNPLLRIMLFLLISLFLIIIIWASVSHLDVVVVGQGKIVPSGSVKTIQSAEKGTVTAIYVKNGQYVKKDQVLMTLASDYTQADIQKLNSIIAHKKILVAVENKFYARLKSNSENNLRLNQIKFKKSDLPLGKIALNHAQLLLWQKWRAYIAKLRSLKAGLAIKEEERVVIHLKKQQMLELLDIMDERLIAYRKLYGSKAIAKMEYLDTKQEHLNAEYALKQEYQKEKELAAYIKEVKSQLVSYKAENYLQTLQIINQTKQELYTHQQELKKAITLDEHNAIKSPINGIIHEMQVNTIHAIITPAQILMQVVPLDNQLEVQAYFRNQDIGYLHIGQTAEVKVNTYSFTDYGVLHGKIINISSDAIEEEQHGLVYKVTIALKVTTLHKGNKKFKVSSGMEVGVEAKTGSRTVLEYFMEPILRGINNSFKER